MRERERERERKRERERGREKKTIVREGRWLPCEGNCVLVSSIHDIVPIGRHATQYSKVWVSNGTTTFNDSSLIHRNVLWFIFFNGCLFYQDEDGQHYHGKFWKQISYSQSKQTFLISSWFKQTRQQHTSQKFIFLSWPFRK